MDPDDSPDHPLDDPLDHPLDNPGWSALTGPQSGWAQRLGGAARFDPELSPFAALVDDDASTWADLARLVGPGGAALLAGGPQTAPPGWTPKLRLDGFQMVADSVAVLDDDELVPLGDADVPDILALVERTRPGPFARRTHEFGGYLGVRRDGHLIAMAGERFRIEGFAEISAVCTDEVARGQGLAGRLVRAVATNIERRGETPILHVAGTNEGAISLYRKLGFRTRRAITFSVFTAPTS